MTSVSNLLVTPQVMAEIDEAAARTGLDSRRLMQQAGDCVSATALKYFPDARRFVVFCGPGNNGGDGFIAATSLRASGASVFVYRFKSDTILHGDAAWAASCWGADAADIDAYVPTKGDVVIDAVFGAGLSRDIDESLGRVMTDVEEADVPVIAVDLPSGVSGESGQVLGRAFRAKRTVTFVCRKPGHILMPGRALCGEIKVFDIGIPSRIVEAHVDANLAVNEPPQWRVAMPKDQVETHKYKRGHLAVFSGSATKTGAARMAAMAGLKTGAGLVTVAAPKEALTVNSEALTAIMLHEIDSESDLATWLEDPRLSTFVLGPGFGIGEQARKFVEAISGRHLVLDADGITSFKDKPEKLYELFARGDVRLVLTPHEGEFHRLFPDIAEGKDMSKVEKARLAARRSHGVVVYKGADTVIASPDGRALINENAPAWLATAGAGDVLAGIIGGLMAQGVPAFEAAAAAVWLHGEAAHRAGRGLTAEDLVAAVQPFHA